MSPSLNDACNSDQPPAHATQATLNSPPSDIHVLDITDEPSATQLKSSSQLSMDIQSIDTLNQSSASPITCTSQPPIEIDTPNQSSASPITCISQPSMDIQLIDTPNQSSASPITCISQPPMEIDTPNQSSASPITCTPQQHTIVDQLSVTLPQKRRKYNTRSSGPAPSLSKQICKGKSLY